MDLEAQSHVYVRTPLANEYWARKKADLEKNKSYAKGIRLNLSAPEVPCHFTPGGGVPQGDKLSCLYWTMLEDICLAALRIDGKIEPSSISEVVTMLYMRLMTFVLQMI